MTRIGRISVWPVAVCLSAFLPSIGSPNWLPPVPLDETQERPDELFVDEDTGEIVRPEPPPLRRSIPLSHTFDQLVFGGRPDATAIAAGRLEKVLHFKLEDVSRQCRLTEAQKQKLLLAGRGDVKHLIDRIYDERKPYESLEATQVDAAISQKLRSTAMALQKQVTIGPFGEGSILAKVLQRILTPEQFAAYVVTDEIEQLGGRMTTVVRGNVEVRDVNLAGARLADGCLPRLMKLPNLTRLTAEMLYLTNEGLAPLSEIATLETLDLSRTQVSSPGMAHLAGLKNLQVVVLRNTVVGDEGLAHLGRIASLRELHLQGTPVTDAGLSHLKRLEQLELLNLGRTRITDSGLLDLNLPNLTRLKELGLSHIQVGDPGMKLIGRCANLERLILIGTPITDSTIRHLRNLKKLRYLLIDQTSITDDGLAALADLASLESLEASNTPIGDIGLLSLRKLAGLKYLNVANTHVTDDGVSEFHRALPDVVVHK